MRRYTFKWGLIAGAAGGLFMIRPELFWQIVGIAAVVFISNYHINKAARYIPRWHATVISFLGVLLGMFSIIIAGSIILFYIQQGGSGEGSNEINP
jgi:hypothetical protein